MIREAKYADVRDKMQPGDVILFGGTGWISRIVKAVTGSPVSHAGIVLDAYDSSFHRVVQLIESTSLRGLRGFKGVSTCRLSTRLDGYDGAVWWLPLSSPARDRLDVQKMQGWLESHNLKRYDGWQCFRAGFRALFGRNIFRVKESYKKFFCSELVAGALGVGGALLGDRNPSTITPSDLARFRVYDTHYYQLSGKRRSIPEYNTRIEEMNADAY